MTEETSTKDTSDSQEMTEVTESQPLVAGTEAIARYSKHPSDMLMPTLSSPPSPIRKLGIVFDIDGTLVAEHKREVFGRRIQLRPLPFHS